MINPIYLFTLLMAALNVGSISKPAVIVATKASNLIETVADHKSREENAEFIPWTEERLLTWADFYGAPQKDGEAVASTSTALGISYQIKGNDLSYQINCSFSKQRSWGSLKTEYILAHEQAHFDITELFARKLHRQLLNYKLYQKDKSNYKQDINNIYQNVVRQKEAMQQQYDAETDHSRHKKQQLAWFDKITQMLDESQPYAAYP